MIDVCTIGSITLDFFIEPFDIGLQNDYFHFPVGDKIRIKKIHKFIGGGAANTATGFSKLNLKTAIFGVVGNDHDNDFIIRTLQKNNINTKFLICEKDESSSTSFILLTPNGGRTVFHHRNTNTHFGPKILDTIPPCRAIYIGHLYDESQKLFSKLKKYKQKNKNIIAWNPGKTQFQTGFEYFKNIFALIDILILNVEESELFTKIKAIKLKNEAVQRTLNLFDKKDEENALGKKISLTSEHSAKYHYDVRKIAQKFLDNGVKKIFITDGGNGAQFFDKNHHFLCPAPNKKPKSTLGAGDAFSVGVLASELYNQEVSKQILWGTYNANSVTQKFGAQEGLLTFEEIGAIV